MILDRLEYLAQYSALHPGIEKAAAFLAATDPYALTGDQIEIDGTSVYAFVQDNRLTRTEEVYEVHAKYADIQLVLEGRERFGWSADKEIAEIDPGRDIGFGPAQTHQSFVLSKGEFVLFMPGEAHAPCLTAGAVGDPCRKLVIKIRMC